MPEKIDDGLMTDGDCRIGEIGDSTRSSRNARSISPADTSAVMPFDFSRVIFGAILAWLIFDEIADKWVWTGALIIFAAGYVTTRLEAKKP